MARNRTVKGARESSTSQRPSGYATKGAVSRTRRRPRPIQTLPASFKSHLHRGVYFYCDSPGHSFVPAKVEKVLNLRLPLLAMQEKNKNEGFESGAKSGGFCRAKRKVTFGHLIIYLLYIGVVLAVGAQLGAFPRRSLPSPKVLPMVRTTSTSTLPNPPVQINQLPQGILAFDAELKQASVIKGEAQAHFAFNLTNVSQQPVIIDAVNASCGCTAAQLPQVPWTLKPRENGQIQVTVNLPPVVEKTTKTITVITPQGVKTLKMEATILPATNSLQVVRPAVR